MDHKKLVNSMRDKLDIGIEELVYYKKHQIEEKQQKMENERMNKKQQNKRRGQNTSQSIGNSKLKNFFDTEVGIENGKIKQNLLLMAVDQVNELINERVSLPKALEQNKYIWARSMLKMKAVQDLINAFQNEIKTLVTEEFRKNEQKIQKFMRVIRPPDHTINDSRQYLDSFHKNCPNEQQQEQIEELQRIMTEKNIIPKFKDSQSSFKISKRNFSNRNLNKLLKCTISSSDEDTPHKKHNHHGHNHGHTTHSNAQSATLSTGKEECPTSGDGQLNFNELARFVKDHHDLYQVIKDNLVPEDLPHNIAPTDQWLKEIAFAQAGKMNTFNHKKVAMENINIMIKDEIARKKGIMEMGETLINAAESLKLLDEDFCAFFSKRNENDELNNKPALIRNFEMNHRVDPVKASLLIHSRAIGFMADWSCQKLPEHHKTIEGWRDVWNVNQNFEEQIMNEEKGYRLIMRNMQNFYVTKQQALIEKFQMHIEALEITLNEVKMNYMHKIDQLEMQLADVETQNNREAEQMEQQDANENEIAQLIEKMPKIYSLKDALSFISKIRLSIKYYVVQQKLKEKQSKNKEIEYEQAAENQAILKAENEAKQKIFEWFHNYVIIGSKSSMPRPFITPDQRKKLEFMKSENLFGQYISFLNANDIDFKIQTEINMSKIFSILIFNISSIFGEIGLFQSNENFLERPGNNQKFLMSNNQLIEILKMFKNEQVEKQMTILFQQRALMQKFRAKMATSGPKGPINDAGDAEKETETEEIGEDDKIAIKKIGYTKRIQEQHEKLNEKDYLIKPYLPKSIVDLFQMEETEKNIFCKIDNSGKLIEAINKQLVKVSKAQHVYDDAYQIKLVDLVLIDDDCLKIHSEKFAVFLNQNKFAFESENRNQIQLQLVMIIKSIISINKFISGNAVEQKCNNDHDHSEDILYGDFYLHLSDLSAKEEGSQCLLVDPAAIEKRLEKTYTHRYERKMDILRLSIQDRDQRIGDQMKDIRKKEELLQNNGVQFEQFKEEVIVEREIQGTTDNDDDHSGSCGGHKHDHSHDHHDHEHGHGHGDGEGNSTKQGEHGHDHGGHAKKHSPKRKPEVLPPLLKEMEMLVSFLMAGGKGIDIDDLENIKAYKKDLTSIKSLRNGITKLKEFNHNKFFAIGTLGDMILKGLKECIKNTIQSNNSLNIQSYRSDLSSESQKKIFKAKRLSSESAEILHTKNIEGDSSKESLSGNGPRTKNRKYRERDTSQTYIRKREQIQQSGSQSPNSTLKIKNDLLLMSSENKNAFESFKNSKKNLIIKSSLNKQDSITKELKGFENWTAADQLNACKKLMNSYEMDQILLKEKYEIFPNQKKLKIDQYNKIAKKLDRLTYMNSRSNVSSSLVKPMHQSNDWETIQPQVLTPKLMPPSLNSQRFFCSRGEKGIKTPTNGFRKPILKKKAQDASIIISPRPLVQIEEEYKITGISGIEEMNDQNFYSFKDIVDIPITNTDPTLESPSPIMKDTNNIIMPGNSFVNFYQYPAKYSNKKPQLKNQDIQIENRKKQTFSKLINVKATQNPKSISDLRNSTIGTLKQKKEIQKEAKSVKEFRFNILKSAQQTVRDNQKKDLPTTSFDNTRTRNDSKKKDHPTLYSVTSPCSNEGISNLFSKALTPELSEMAQGSLDGKKSPMLQSTQHNSEGPQMVWVMDKTRKYTDTSVPNDLLTIKSKPIIKIMDKKQIYVPKYETSKLNKQC